MPTAVVANSRSSRLVDELDDVGPVVRSRDPRVLERWLPALLEREPDRRARTFLAPPPGCTPRIGRLEVAVVADGDVVRAGLLTLVEGDDRWPWWGSSDVGGLRTELGAPLVRPDGGLARPAARRGQRSPTAAR